MLRGSTGLVHCAQALCDSIPMGGMGRFDVGYRAGYYSLWVTVDGGGGRLDVQTFEDAEGLVSNVHGDLTFLHAGVGVAFHPVDLGRVDPWLGIGFGYSQTKQRFRADQRSYDLLYRRGGVMPGGGIDVFLAHRVAMGPRADIVLPFGGSRCIRQGGVEECLNVVDVVDSNDAAISRARRRAFPRPWSVSVQVTVYLP